ncbi:MAG: hypothetical protein AAFY19_08345, partial [Pseudomonadota bacterium]
MLFEGSLMHQPQAISALQSTRNHQDHIGVHVGNFSNLACSFNLFLIIRADFHLCQQRSRRGIPMVLTKFLKHIGSDSQGATAV